MIKQQTITIRIRYQDCMDDAPESWDIGGRLGLIQEGESVEILAAGKLETLEESAQ